MGTGEGGGLAQPEPWGGFQELRRAEGTVTVKAWCDEEKEEVEMTEVRKLCSFFTLRLPYFHALEKGC